MKKRGFGKFLAGLAIGAGIGVLFAPKSGKETRADIKKKCDEIIEKAKTLTADDVKKAITKKANEIKKGLKELDKEKVLKIAKEKATQTYEAAKKKFEAANHKAYVADSLIEVGSRMIEENKEKKTKCYALFSSAFCFFF